MCKEPEYIKRSVQSSELVDFWIAELDWLESQTKYNDQSNRIEERFGLFLFPIIDSIARSLGLSMRAYLRDRLGYKKPDDDLICKIFRNGQLHNLRPVSIEYQDGNRVRWGMSWPGGGGSIPDYDPGYESANFPALNTLAEKAFEYLRSEDGSYHASLQLDRLAAHVRYDLLRLKETYPKLDVVVAVKDLEQSPPKAREE